jgi:hypothetical protein
MILPSIAGNDSRCGIALRVFLGELSAISCQYQYPLSANFPYNHQGLRQLERNLPMT